MKITKLAHAGMILTAGGTKIAVDPLVHGYSISVVYGLPPDYKLNKRALSKIQFNGIVISHHHQDHYHLESLSYFKRSTPVHIPAKSEFMEEELKAIGFKDVRRFSTEQEFHIGSIGVVPTASRVPFPENGFIFRHAGVAIYNLVDSQPSDDDLLKYKTLYGRPDLMFAFFQARDEYGVPIRNLSTVFPVNNYEKLLGRVRVLEPKSVVPSSCDLICLKEAWLNSHIFPVTKKQFIDDVRKCDPDIRGHTMEPGVHLDVTPRAIRRTTAPLPELGLKECKPARHRWQPDVGHFAVIDHEPLRGSVVDLKREALKFLDGPLLGLIRGQSLDSALQPLIEKGLTWKLRLVCPDQTEIVRWMDFSKAPFRWQKISSKLKDAPAAVETVVGAGDFLAYTAGKIENYAIGCGHYGMTIVRQYEVKNWKVNQIKEPYLPFLLSFFIGRWVYYKSTRLKLRKLGVRTPVAYTSKPEV